MSTSAIFRSQVFESEINKGSLNIEYLITTFAAADVDDDVAIGELG